MITKTTKQNIIESVWKYLKDELCLKYYKYRNDNKYCHIYNMCHVNDRVYNDTREDISLSNFNILCEVISYDEEYTEYISYYKRFMTLPELFTDGWIECDQEEYYNCYKKVIEQIKLTIK